MSVETPNSTEGTALRLSPASGHDGRDVFQLANSFVALEHGPAGVMARVVHRTRGVDYAGPLDDATISALRDAAATCRGGGK